MASESTPSLDEKSLSRLLLELLWQITVLVLPMVLVALLPPLLAFALVLGCAGLMGLFARLGFERLAKGCARLMTSCVFGLGFSLARVLPEYWNIAGAFVSIFGGLACVSTWEQRLGLASTPAGPAPSAWGGGEPQQTPEGEPIRVFNLGEIAMGGPTYCDYLFPNGVLLEGLGSSALFSSDGRYFAAPVPSRNTWGLAILDRAQRRLYRCLDTEHFWELDEFTDQALTGRCSPLMENASRQTRLEDLLQAAEAVDLVAVADLWLEPGDWQASLALDSFERLPAMGPHRLEAHLQLPASLREQPQPAACLRDPEYRLSLDGEATPLLIRADSPVVWSATGDALVCLARSQADEEAPSPYWLWQAGRGWRALAHPWVAAEGEPSFYWSAPLQLDEHWLWVESYLDYPKPDLGRFGYGLQSIHSDTETQVGHDPQGRMQVAELHLTRTRLAMPLTSSGERGAAAVESAPLLDGRRARLAWLRDNDAGLGAYACSLGDWRLAGEWLLDHRVSDCGRYIALVPFAQAPAVPGQVVVVDVLEQRLLHGPAMLVARLLDFRAGRLSLAVVQGRLQRDAPGGPLQRFDQSAPEAALAAAFCAYREDSRLYFESCDLLVEPTGLLRLPAWRLVTQPQVADADGDFIQPAPLGGDAAWLFGSDTEYADSWLRERTPRLGGHLLTASGCALGNLAPSMIWSANGRYLALTRLCTEMDDAREGRMAWQLLLLDVQERSLRLSPRWLRSRPLFERFDADGLRVRLFARDWESPDEFDPGAIQHLDTSELLALPAEPLLAQGELWLAETEQDNAAAWLALDKTPLQSGMQQLAALGHSQQEQ